MAPTKKGKETRNVILDMAVNLASIEGLDGLTIGRLSKALDMSKSGLFGHFGSKEDLQLATVQTAKRIFFRQVIVPSQDVKHGIVKIWALCDNWLTYMEGGTFQGGCFFCAASAEFDNRPGLVRDAISASMKEWLDYLTSLIQKAQAQEELKAEFTAEQIAFELHAFCLNANWALQLLNDTSATYRARVAILNRLHGISQVNTPDLPMISTISEI